MKVRLIRALALLAVLSLSLAAAGALPPGWYFEGCWSPYPNCAGGKDVYRDASGGFWQCGACGTTTDPGPSTCYLSGNLYAIGYWCS